jgi:outer membrane protein OmpA-like peptidoglycan-associated protein
MDKRFVIAFSVLTTIYSFELHAQFRSETIRLQNSSFEDIPRCCMPPAQWENGVTSGETPPDIQPGYFSVSKPPKNGNTYVGLVVRDNDTHEAISQRLSSPLKKNQCYRFSIWLCRSELYLSQSPTTKKPANYITPVKVCIYGAGGYTAKMQQLAISDEINNTDWKEYTFEFKPNQDYAYLIIEANHKKPILFPYNGNVLVDYASEIVPIKCDEKEIARSNPKPPRTTTRPPDVGGVASVKPSIPSAYDKPSIVSVTPTYDRKKMKVGQTIRIEKLYFDADSTNLKRSAYPVLDELYLFMLHNKDVSIEVGGHTNDIPADAFCEKLSTARARAVAEYLIYKGIDETRVRYRGYGKQVPLFPNLTPENRKRNQRVEIKILSIG